jgi:two-component system sensor histidine kinase UhpB
MSSQTSRPADGGRPRRRYVPLLHRVVSINVLLLIASVVLTIIVLVPGHESSARLDEEGVVLLVTVALAILVNVLLLRRVVRPLQQLTGLARTVDLTDTRPRLLPEAAPTSEAGELALTFNEMLGRLQTERREATGRVLAAQEGERLRVARELHDGVGQELTAVLLLLARVQARAPEDLRPAVREAQEAVRASLQDVRRIAVELRPEALDDLGLVSALAVLCERFVERTGIRVDRRLPDSLPALSSDVELVIYRVAQEGLTNVARHSGSRTAMLALESGDGEVVLSVRDAGTGLGSASGGGSGIRGMRERAGLIGANLQVGDLTGEGGCEVRLAVPAEG